LNNCTVFCTSLLSRKRQPDLQTGPDLRISYTSYSVGPICIKQYVNEAASLSNYMRLYKPIMKMT